MTLPTIVSRLRGSMGVVARQVLAGLLVAILSLGVAFGQGTAITPPAAGTSPITATGAPTSVPLGDLAAQQGVLLDAFRVAGDADDTASMTRAVAAGVPILLGPKTYTVNNYAMAGTPASFVLRGLPGKSAIQRTSASGSQFFQITAATVVIDGVTFDMNKASVTANQWGVFLGAGGQTINVRNSVFKNNSGSLGSCLDLLSTGPAAGGSFSLVNSEITGCTFNPLYLASISNGDVSGNYIHDNTAGAGMYVLANGTASSSNYSANIVIRGNRFIQNTGPGLAIGSFGPPYIYGNPAATNISVKNNLFLDNTGYQLGFTNVQQISVVGNTLTQSSSGVTAFGGIDCNAQYFMIESNYLSFPSASYGIDCGAATEPLIAGNHITMGARGAAIDVGGVQNGQVLNNHVTLGGTATGVAIVDVETDGSVVPFPYHTSNVTVRNNDILLSGTSTSGIQVLDNAGGAAGALPVNLFDNRFTGVSSATATQDISYFTTGSAVRIQGNTHNGEPGVAVALNGNTDYVFESVYDYVQGDSTAGSVRAIVNSYVNTYNAGTKILYVTVTSGGSGYTSATTLSASGGCTWAGTPLISAGAIIGVRTTGTGASCSGATTVTAADSGGGTGATFTPTVTPALPGYKTIIYRSAASAGNVIKTGGGAIGIGGSAGPIPVVSQGALTLRASVAGSSWILPSGVPPTSYAIGSLPTCDSNYSGAIVAVTGSVSGKWQARCNGTNWVAPDGTTIS